jgi:hypothetical protein
MIFLSRTIREPMNIIELFDKLELIKEAIAGYTAGDVIRVEKQLNVERKINPEVDANTATSLVHALRDFPNPFIFVLGDRHLYNFFTGKDLSRKRFPENNIEVDREKVRGFIARFLGDELEFTLDKALADERFGTIRELLAVSEYLPEESLHRLEKRVTGKLEFGIGRMPREGKIDTSGIGYMRLMSFYEVLSHFSSIEMDEKIRIVINRTSDMYNSKRERKFASDVMICLPSYKAFDDDLNRIMAGNRGVVSSGNTISGSGSSGSGWASSGRIIFIVIIIIVKLVIFSSRCSNNNDYNNYGTGYGGNSGLNEALSTYKYETRRNDVRAAAFFDYLTMYDRETLTDIKPADTIKTGQNPYKRRFFQKLANIHDLPGQLVTFANRTPYDMILFEFADSSAFNMESDAYFIKSGHKLDVKISNTGNTRQEYSFYFGNDLAMFKSANDTIYVNDTLNSFRFMKIAPYSRDILNKKFRFVHDVTVSKDGNHLRMKSEGLKGVTDSLTKQGEYVF